MANQSRGCIVESEAPNARGERSLDAKAIAFRIKIKKTPQEIRRRKAIAGP
jgi:hypothetical protein